MKFYLPLLPLLFLTACSSFDYKDGPELEEPGTVQDTCFVPAGHGSTSSVGFGTDGKLRMSRGSVYLPERYAVVFKCLHGSFVVEGEKAKALFSRVKKGDNVTIRYCESLWINGGETNVIGLHFIDADVVKGEQK